jgi:hypothetical protein
LGFAFFSASSVAFDVSRQSGIEDIGRVMTKYREEPAVLQAGTFCIAQLAGAGPIFRFPL